MFSRPVVGLLIAASLGIAGPAAAIEPTQIVHNAIEGYIRPAYGEFHAAAGDLAEAGKELCEAPSEAALEKARRAFGGAVDSWSRIEIIRFGPVTEGNRLERVLFWPDRKGTGLKQVQAALAGEDPTATNAAQLASKSVAMQGLGALEFVLYGTGSETLATGDDYRCAYGAAIGQNLEAIAMELDAAWADPEGFAKIWENPSEDNPLYRDEAEALTDLMDVFITGTELVRDVRLGGFLGKEPKNDKPRLALFWRSGKTVDALAGNLAGMHDLLERSKLFDALPEDQISTGKTVFFDFGNAARAAEGANGPIAEVLDDPDRRAKLAYFGLVTTTLSRTFGNQISGALGLTAGFSSLDGD